MDGGGNRRATTGVGWGEGETKWSTTQISVGYCTRKRNRIDIDRSTEEYVEETESHIVRRSRSQEKIRIERLDC